MTQAKLKMKSFASLTVSLIHEGEKWYSESIKLEKLLNDGSHCSVRHSARLGRLENQSLQGPLR